MILLKFKKTLLIMVICCPLVSLNSLPVGNTVLEYDIVKGNNTIGQLKASQKVHPDQILYDIESEVNISFLFSLNISFKYNSKFESNFLTWSDFSNVTNNKERESTEILWEKYRYKVKRDEEESFISKSQIEYTLSKMYFKEPLGKERVFSERFAEYLTITKTGDHVYELTLPDGKKNIYTFENGICKEVKVDHTLATFYFKLKK